MLASNLHRIEGNLDTAYFYIEEAATHNTQIIGNKKRFYDPILQLTIVKQKANILATIHPEEALNTYLFCDTLTQEILKQYHYQDNQLAFVKLSNKMYHEAMLFSLQQLKKKPTDTWKKWLFYFSEKKKAQVLQIHKEKLKLTQLLNIPSEILEQERDIQRSLAYYNTKLRADVQKQSKYIDSLIKYDKFYEEFINETQKNYPDFYELRYSRKIPSLSTIQTD